MPDIINKIREELINNADENTKLSGERFFKESVTMYGIRSATVISIGKDYFKTITDKSKAHIFSLCDELWKSGNMEESFVACNWSFNVQKQYEPGDFDVFEKWVNTYVGNWASCDTLCNHTVGTFIEMYTEYLSGLKKWAKSPNRWVKRVQCPELH